MGNKAKNAPMAGERAKGASHGSAQNQTPKSSQIVASRATRYPKFMHQDQAPIQVSGKVERTLMAVIFAGAEGITARRCGPWAYRLAAFIHVLRLRHELEIMMCRIQTGRSWHGSYSLESPVIISARKR